MLWQDDAGRALNPPPPPPVFVLLLLFLLPQPVAISASAATAAMSSPRNGRFLTVPPPSRDDDPTPSLRRGGKVSRHRAPLSSFFGTGEPVVPPWNPLLPSPTTAVRPGKSA